MNESNEPLFKALFVCDAFWPYLGGAEVCALMVLSKLVGRGLEVSVLTHRFHGTKPQEVHKKLKIERDSLFRPRSLTPLTIDFFHRVLFYFKAVLVIFRCVQKYKPQLVLSQQLISIPATIVSRFLRVPIIVVVHDYWPVCYNRTILRPNGQVCSSCDTCFREIYKCAKNDISHFLHEPKILHPISAILYSVLISIHTLFAKYAIRRANAIIAVSQFVKKTLVLNGFDPKRIHVVYNPIVVQDHIEAKSPNIPRILFVGRLEFEKGAEILLKAVPRICARIAPIEVVIVGRGREEARLRCLARGMQIEDCVEFLGKVSDDFLWHLYKSSTVVVVPSIWAEPFGRVAAEAILCGRPVVASNVGGISELVDERNGVLVAPRNSIALAKAIVSVILNRDLPHNHFEVRKTFSLDVISEQYLAVIKSVV